MYNTHPKAMIRRSIRKYIQSPHHASQSKHADWPVMSEQSPAVE